MYKRQGQTGYPCYHCTDLTAMLPDYIDAWGKNNAHFDAIYSGFLTGAEQISQDVYKRQIYGRYSFDAIISSVILTPVIMVAKSASVVIWAIDFSKLQSDGSNEAGLAS